MTWKPVNPCTADCSSRDSYCPPRNRFGCDSYEIYQGAIDAQRKLLEYLDDTRAIDMHVTIASMLKQLEEMGI